MHYIGRVSVNFLKFEEGEVVAQMGKDADNDNEALDKVESRFVGVMMKLKEMNEEIRGSNLEHSKLDHEGQFLYDMASSKGYELEGAKAMFHYG